MLLPGSETSRLPDLYLTILAFVFLFRLVIALGKLKLSRLILYLALTSAGVTNSNRTSYSYSSNE